MSTEHENAGYRSRPVLLSEAAAHAFQAAFIPKGRRRPQAIDISGECPSCHHFMRHVLYLREFGPDTEATGGMQMQEALLQTGSAEAARESEPSVPEAELPTYKFTLNCNCAETHASAGKDDAVTGCGAWFNVEVASIGEVALLRPGSPKLSLYEAQKALTRDQLASSELERVRAAAGNWKTGLGALFLLIPTLVVVKGTDTVNGLATADKIIVGGLIAFGAALAFAATLIALRAANGPVKRQKIAGDDRTIPVVTEVERTVGALQATRILTVVASAALAAAIAYAWAAPPTKPGLSVDLTNGSGYCGKLVGLHAGVMQIETADGVTRPLPTADVTSATFVSSC